MPIKMAYEVMVMMMRIRLSAKAMVSNKRKRKEEIQGPGGFYSLKLIFTIFGVYTLLPMSWMKKKA